MRTSSWELTFSSVEPDSAIISSLSFSMKGMRWPTAFFMTRADLMTCKRTRWPTGVSTALDRTDRQCWRFWFWFWFWSAGPVIRTGVEMILTKLQSETKLILIG